MILSKWPLRPLACAVPVWDSSAVPEATVSQRGVRPLSQGCAATDAPLASTLFGPLAHSSHICPACRDKRYFQINRRRLARCAASRASASGA